MNCEEFLHVIFRPLADHKKAQKNLILQTKYRREDDQNSIFPELSLSQLRLQKDTQEFKLLKIQERIQ